MQTHATGCTSIRSRRWLQKHARRQTLQRGSAVLVRSAPDQQHAQRAPDIRASDDGEPREGPPPPRPQGVTSSGAGGTLPYSFIATLAGLGTAETAYLSLTKLLGTTPVCPISGCETVLSSSYSEVAGVPLPLLGMLVYGGVAGLSTIAGTRRQLAPEQLQPLDTAITAGVTLLAGVSGLLLYILQTSFAGEPCVWCYASAGLSFALLATVVASAPARQLASAAVPSAGALAAAVAALYLGTSTNPSTATDFELPYEAPVVTAPSPPEAKVLAKRLKESGAAMYGAFWCSHCYDQKQAFGQEAMADFPYVECYPNGWKRGVALEAACEAAGVRAFPTWVINGQLVEGELSLEVLAAKLENVEAAAPAPAQ